MRVRDDVDLGELMLAEVLQREYEGVCAEYDKALALGDLSAVAELGKKKKSIFRKIGKAIKKIVKAPAKLIKGAIKTVKSLVTGGKAVEEPVEEIEVPPPAASMLVTTPKPTVPTTFYEAPVDDKEPSKFPIVPVAIGAGVLVLALGVLMLTGNGKK